MDATEAVRRNMPLVLVGEGRDGCHLDEVDIWNALTSHGAVLFHGFDIDADGFYDFASRFNRAFLTSPFGDRKAVSDRNELQTVTLGQLGLSLHFEYGNSPLRPDLLWFYCRRPAARGAGGETLVADGAAVFAELNPSTQRVLLERRIKYTIFLPREDFETIFYGKAMRAVAGDSVLEALVANGDSKVVELTRDRVVLEHVALSTHTASDGRIQLCQNCFSLPYKHPSDADAEGTFSTLVTWEDGSAIQEAVVEELKRAARSATRGIRWQSGDFVLIDNNRVLHGRRPTKDPERDIVMLCSFSKRYRFGRSLD